MLDVACRLHPAVGMVDLSLAQLGSLDPKVIALSVHGEYTVRSAAMVAGADAFVLERAVATDLLRAVERVSVVDECQRSTRSA